MVDCVADVVVVCDIYEEFLVIWNEFHYQLIFFRGSVTWKKTKNVSLSIKSTVWVRLLITNWKFVEVSRHTLRRVILLGKPEWEKCLHFVDLQIMVSYKNAIITFRSDLSKSTGNVDAQLLLLRLDFRVKCNGVLN